MHNLIELKKVIPGITLDLLYATERNFMGKAVYPTAHCFLLESTAERLLKVEKKLKKRNLRLKIYDGYRPWSVTKIFWDYLPDSRYVADPALGSRHNRGAAIDLTLIDLDGKELLMPSAFDEFSEKAHRSYQGGPLEALQNREILSELMEQEGFSLYAYEWWHFDDPEWEKYPILDLSFKELLDFQRQKGD